LLAPLLALTIYYGVHPGPILDSSAASVQALINNFNEATATTKAAMAGHHVTAALRETYVVPAAGVER